MKDSYAKPAVDYAICLHRFQDYLTGSQLIADMPSLHSHLMIGGIHVDGIDTEALLSSLFCWNDHCAVVFQRLVGRDRRFDDPLLLQLLPSQIFRDGMHQRQAEVAARDLCHRAGGRLQDAQAIAVPGRSIGFIDADRGQPPPSEVHKESVVRD